MGGVPYKFAKEGGEGGGRTTKCNHERVPIHVMFAVTPCLQSQYLDNDVQQSYQRL